MDSQRLGVRRRRNLWRLAFAVVAAGLVLQSVGALRPLLVVRPRVSRQAVVTGGVEQGDFVHTLRGVGHLVSEEITLITAKAPGRVLSLTTLPGHAVRENTILLQLVNPELVLSLEEAQSQLGAARAERKTQAAILQHELLQLEAAWRKLEADHEQAEAKHQVSLELRRRNANAISAQAVKLQEIEAASLAKQQAFAQQGRQRFAASLADRLAVYDERIRQAETRLSRAQADVSSMVVLAGAAGVLAELPLEIGQQVEPGELLAKVVNPQKLKAELRVAEVEARFLRVGQSANVDTHHGWIPGTVTRIDPAVDRGQVTIEVRFASTELPAEVRPQLSVRGAVEVDRKANVLWVQRPVGAQPNSEGFVYRVEGDSALRVAVRFGAASMQSIVVREGLREGDEIITSSTAAFDEELELQLE